jgi:hypothetical protein
MQEKKERLNKDELIIQLYRAIKESNLAVTESLLACKPPVSALVFLVYWIAASIKTQSPIQHQIFVKIKTQAETQWKDDYSAIMHINTDKITQTVIPDNISVVWLGSFLKEEHQKRIVQWKHLNPSHQIYLWISPALIDADVYKRFVLFCNDHQIVLMDVTNLHSLMGKRVRDWIQILNDRTHINYAALSDLYRLYLLKAKGGWYFDTDILPDKLPLNLKLPYGFAIDAYDNHQKITTFTPAILVSSCTNAFLDSVDVVSDAFAQYYALDETLQSHNVLERFLGTQLCTGKIVFTAVYNLLVNNDEPVSHPYNPFDDQIFNLKIYQQISIERATRCSFRNMEESSWIFNENRELHNGLTHLNELLIYVNNTTNNLPASIGWLDLTYQLIIQEIPPVFLQRPVVNPEEKTTEHHDLNPAPLWSGYFFKPATDNDGKEQHGFLTTVLSFLNCAGGR